jgi:hypothetical protein
MNAPLHLTVAGIAMAVNQTPRADQTVYRCRSTYSGSALGSRHVVLVVPEGEQLGRYFECGDRSLALLQAGMTPGDLELDDVTDEYEQEGE